MTCASAELLVEPDESVNDRFGDLIHGSVGRHGSCAQEHQGLREAAFGLNGDHAGRLVYLAAELGIQRHELTVSPVEGEGLRIEPDLAVEHVSGDLLQRRVQLGRFMGQ